MINDSEDQERSWTPFILRFANRMDSVQSPPLRYDETRQIAQVLISNRWIDTPDAAGEISATTRMSKVNGETTDDQ